MLAATIFLACKSHKSAIKTSPHDNVSNEIVHKNDLVQTLRKQQTQFEFFSAKIKIDFAQERGKDVSFTLHLKMESGKYIWMSATAVLGIEAARIYISRDSIKILDKLNKRYLTQSYSYFTRFSDVPLTLEVLQNLFVGNQILELDDTLKTDSVASGYLLRRILNKTLYQVYVTKSTNEIFLQEFVRADSSQTNRLSVQYSEFHRTNNVRYANKMSIKTEAKDILMATFDFQNVSLNPIDQVIFSIPASYSPME
jgi:hypothetical protein